jgi:hypothetical protein
MGVGAKIACRESVPCRIEKQALSAVQPDGGLSEEMTVGEFTDEPPSGVVCLRIVGKDGSQLLMIRRWNPERILLFGIPEAAAGLREIL